MKKQYLMMNLILNFYDKSADALKNGASINAIEKMAVREQIGRFKYTHEDDIQKQYDAVIKDLDNEISDILSNKED